MTRITRIPGMALIDHTFTVPLDHSRPDGPTIEVFAREVVDPTASDKQRPWLCFLQGGPGGKAGRPNRAVGWLQRALRTHRVLLLDQRGTGRSTPITPSLAARTAPEALAGLLRHMRADAIVADAEFIRRRLCGDEPWETLGQSYGGFITLAYLSRAPEGLKSCYVTGGLIGLDCTAEDVYHRTYPRVRAKNAEYYARYPDDVEAVRRLADHLAANDVRLPDGDRLTARRLRFIGQVFGMGDGFERVHWMLDEAWDGDRVSDTFRAAAMHATALTDQPLWAVLQEPIYGQGKVATGWAAEKVHAGLPEFAETADPLLFTGEMMYPWMFEEIAALRPFREAADLLAHHDDWPVLYDVERLRTNPVPVAAAVFFDDMYVDADLSLDTARRVANVRAWVTNEWEHDGSNASGGAILDRLMDMVAGRV
ncbi:alpha/beta fold hydrolase [Embleya scabrispora]|uniref:alpha/beta fold hydrolase n=1 Tax=Embleya scabrispora TaxID=159449 RepID=UPI0003604509|nr:alpha/beta fold hydrolase [Embleya scabrispora]MYS82920.1 alpha/beta fold hydrolase [Streptomyces sp. SID5474]